MEEILVITACLYQKGCEDTANLYYDKRPALREFVKDSELKAKQIAGSLVTNYVAPIIVFGAGGTGTMALHRNVTLKYNRTKAEMIFSYSF